MKLPPTIFRITATPANRGFGVYSLLLAAVAVLAIGTIAATMSTRETSRTVRSEIETPKLVNAIQQIRATIQDCVQRGAGRGPYVGGQINARDWARAAIYDSGATRATIAMDHMPYCRTNTDSANLSLSIPQQTCQVFIANQLTNCGIGTDQSNIGCLVSSNLNNLLCPVDNLTLTATTSGTSNVYLFSDARNTRNRGADFLPDAAALFDFHYYLGSNRAWLVARAKAGTTRSETNRIIAEARNYFSPLELGLADSTLGVAAETNPEDRNSGRTGSLGVIAQPAEGEDVLAVILSRAPIPRLADGTTQNQGGPEGAGGGVNPDP
ncbi:MAG: hypothetical protein AB7U41_07035 [Dongiaceae bacterium]